MAKIGEAYVELSARLTQLEANLQMARKLTTTAVNDMQSQFDTVSIARRAAPGFEMQTSTFNALNNQVAEMDDTMMSARQTIGLTSMALNTLGIRIPGTNLAFMAMSRSSGAVANAVKSVALGIKAVVAVIGPVGIITAVAVGVATYAWNKYQKKLDEVVEAHKKATQEMLQQFATDMKRRLSLEESLITARSKLTDDARTQELKANRIAADVWERQMLDQAESEKDRNEIVLLAIGMRIAANNKYINSIREGQAKQKKESQETAEALEKHVKSVSEKIQGLAKQMTLRFWGVMGREDIVQKLHIEFNLKEQLKQLAEAEQELKNAGQWTQEWAGEIDKVRMGLEKVAEREILQIEQPRFDLSAVQAGYGETAASLARISVSPEFSANVTGAAQENTARASLDVQKQMLAALTGKNQTANMIVAYG